MKPRKFAVFDLDGTLFRSSLYFEIVHELSRSGKLDAITRQAIDSAYSDWKIRKSDEVFWEYANSLMSAYQEQLQDLSPEDYETAVRQVFESQKEYVYVYPKQMLARLKREGYFLLAISGSQVEIIRLFCEYHGFDDWLGSVHERDNYGLFTGNSTITHIDKSDALNELVSKNNLSLEGSIGIGDTQGDTKILNMVEKPIAFNPNKQLYEHAKNNGWELVFERKNVVIQLTKINEKYVLNEKNL